ncbi:hypothetical protein [Magnetospira sp. QH-2]|uniref:hypothetical protein n=1 Tax=Magnetospira sp. (strain QH-2) TaxID=1288970 RepID=UPI0003E81654|nr:hypothetical protein [Magnetospira sp. QH-2]CCQ75748.1 Membrane protein of unknown function [Magnetospira sp. QH-2]
MFEWLNDLIDTVTGGKPVFGDDAEAPAPAQEGDPDFSFDCMSCDLIKEVGSQSDKYGHEVFIASINSAAIILGTAFGIWMIVQIIRIVVGSAKPVDMLKGAAGYLFAATYIGINAGTAKVSEGYSTLYDITIAFMTGLAKTVLIADDLPAREGGPAVGAQALADLSFAIEYKTQGMWMIAKAMMADAGIRLDIYIAGLLFMLPFLFILMMYLGQVTLAMFRVAAVMVLSPWLAIAGAFPATRSMTFGGIKMLVASVIAVAVATIGMGITMYIMTKLSGYMPLVEGEGGEQGVAVIALADFAWSDEYMLAMLVAGLGIMFQWEAASIASNISGSFINSVGPAIFSTVATTALAAPFVVAKAPMAAAAKAGGSAASSALSGSGKTEAYNAVMNPMNQQQQAMASRQ